MFRLSTKGLEAADEKSIGDAGTALNGDRIVDVRAKNFERAGANKAGFVFGFTEMADKNFVAGLTISVDALSIDTNKTFVDSLLTNSSKSVDFGND